MRNNNIQENLIESNQIYSNLIKCKSIALYIIIRPCSPSSTLMLIFITCHTFVGGLKSIELFSKGLTSTALKAVAMVARWNNDEQGEIMMYKKTLLN